jgi:hypothetical protein
VRRAVLLSIGVTHDISILLHLLVVVVLGPVKPKSRSFKNGTYLTKSHA